MLTKDELEQIGKVIDARIDAKVAPLIDAKLDEKLEPIKSDITILKNGQAQNTTMVEAAIAGQQELQKITARETTVLKFANKLTSRVNDHEERITELEKEVGIPHPHKH